jgi:hypothetical protein
MKKAVLIVALVLTFALGLFASDSIKPIYRILKFSTNTVGVYCTNGGDPTVVGNPTGRVLEVSCGN